MDSYFDQLVAEVIDTKLAAAAGYESNLNKDKAVAQAMKMAADRILAEAFLSATINSQISDEAIASAYDTFVADTASREQITATAPRLSVNKPYPCLSPETTQTLSHSRTI